MNSSIQDEILKLKEEKNAIILAHNYQPKEVQEIADFLGDSLELCIKASEIDDKDLVIFCGVDFMAETAFILNPDKKIVIPTLEAECPMAHMLPEEELLKAKEEHPDAGIILYVNSIAEAKQHGIFGLGCISLGCSSDADPARSRQGRASRFPRQPSAIQGN